MTIDIRQQTVSVIAALTGKNNVIPVPVEFVRMCGDYNTAAVLNQILYWSGRTDDPDGWFYKSYAQWEEELALSEYQVRRAVKGDKRSNAPSLTNFGVETKLAETPNGKTMLHYRIQSDVFHAYLVEHLSETTENPIFALDTEQCSERGVNNVQNGGQQCSDSSLTETTTKTRNRDNSSDDELDLHPAIKLALYFALARPNTSAIAQAEQVLESSSENETEVSAQGKRKENSAKEKKKVVAATQNAAIDADDDVTVQVVSVSNNDDTPADNSLSARELNDRYQEITSRAFGLNPGAMTGKLAKFFRGLCELSKKGNETEYTKHQPDEPWTPEQIGGLWIWYWNHPRYGGRSGLSEEERYLPRTISILRDRMDEFQATPEYDERVTRARKRLDAIMSGNDDTMPVDVKTSVPKGYYDNHSSPTHADPIPEDPWEGVDPEERKKQQEMIKEIFG